MVPGATKERRVKSVKEYTSALVALVAASLTLGLVGCTTPAPHPGGPTRAASMPTAIPSAHPTPSAAENLRTVWVRDAAPAAGAIGAVTRDGYGDPGYYTVAAGDTWSNIVDRFGPQLWSLNCAHLTNPLRLQPGDIINLSPYTVASVGHQQDTTTPLDPTTVRACLSQSGLPPQT